MANEKVSAGVAKILAAAKSITARYTTKKTTSILKKDRVAIQEGLNDIGDADVPRLIVGGTTGVPVPDPVVGPTDAVAPNVATGLTAVQVSGTQVDLSCDAGYDPLISGYASGLKETQFYRDGSPIGSPVASGPGLALALSGTAVGAGSGSDSVSNGRDYTVSSTGTGIYGTADAFRFLYAQTSGDVTLIGKFTSFAVALDFAKACLMVRQSLAVGSKYVSFVKFPFANGKGMNLEYRTSTDGSAGQASRVDSTTTPVWGKLTRVGDLFTAYYSTNGNDWIPIGSVTCAMTNPVYVGVAVSSDGTATSASAQIGEVSIQNLARPTYSDTTVSDGNTYAYTAKHKDNDNNESTANASVSVAVGEWSPNYPRLGAYYIPPNRWGSDAYWQRLAYCCTLVFTHYNGAQSAAGRTLRSAIDGIKALVPVSMGAVPKHVAYIIHDETYDAGSGDSATQRLRDKLVAENWYLRNNYPEGAIVESSFASNLDLINRTSAGQQDDAGGKNWIEWYADLMYVQNVTGETGNTANPSLDGHFLDNCYYKERKNGDFDLDGAVDDTSDADFSYSCRDGIRLHFEYMRSISDSNHVQLGNITDLFRVEGGSIYGSSYTPNYSLVAPLYQVIDGGLSEYFLSGASEPFSLEYQERNNGLVGFNANRNAMRFQEGLVRMPGTNIYSVRDSDDTQRRRFGAAFITVCSDGAIDDRLWEGYSSLPAIYTNGTGVGWLGQAVGAAQYTAYQNGVYAREFDNGYVAVNPRNNGSRNITFPVNVRNVVTATNYTAGSNIPLADRDGGFYVKY